MFWSADVPRTHFYRACIKRLVFIFSCKSISFAKRKRRTREHNYYQRTEYQAKFEIIWKELITKGLVKKEVYEIENSDLFKYSPYKSLTHELGHALGLDHIEDPKAIMYRLNNGVNEKLTAGDLELVKNHCGV
ncbi:MAG: matrixin family metalloprotease [Candidatus Zambryskibacteria bacterium]|nr:matrixin family metalloprotease [Candidatus Zambryskibacteria bacterium]